MASDAKEIFDESSGRSSTAGALFLEEAIAKEKPACLRFEATEQALSTTRARLEEAKRVCHRGARAKPLRRSPPGLAIFPGGYRYPPRSSAEYQHFPVRAAARILAALAFPVLLLRVMGYAGSSIRITIYFCRLLTSCTGE